MTKIDLSFARSNPRSTLPLVDLTTGNLSVASVEHAKSAPIQAIATKLLAEGQNEFARLLNTFLPTASSSGQHPPPAQLLKALKDPITISTIIQILYNKMFGSDIASRIAMIRHYFVIGLHESGLNSNSAVRGVVKYQGKNVPTYTRGQLQFITATYRSAVLMGKKLLSQHISLGFLEQAVLRMLVPTGGKWDASGVTPGNDPNQVRANLGQIYYLSVYVTKNFTWTGTHWQPLFIPAIGSNGHTLVTKYAAILANQELGRQLLMTFFHINGPGALKLTKMYHPERLLKDVGLYHQLTSLGTLPELLRQSIPAAILDNMVRGDVDPPIATSDDDEVVVSAVHHNEFIGKLYSLPFDLQAKGTGVVTSPFGVKRTLTNVNTGLTRTAIHSGTDYGATLNQPLFALEDGVVTKSDSTGANSWGDQIEIKPDLFQGILKYAHLNMRLVDVGAKVKKGDIIGLAGKTGFSTGVHLHLQWNPINDKGIAMVATKLPKSMTDGSYAVNKKST